MKRVTYLLLNFKEDFGKNKEEYRFLLRAKIAQGKNIV
jgi:hypothetical protein